MYSSYKTRYLINRFQTIKDVNLFFGIPFPYFQYTPLISVCQYSFNVLFVFIFHYFLVIFCFFLVILYYISLLSFHFTSRGLF